MSNLAIITEQDRAGDGNILPEVEDRIVKELASAIPRMRVFSINGIAEELGVAFPLAKRLRTKAIEKWRTDHTEEIELQKEKIRRWADEMEKLPPNCSRVQQIKNTIELYEKLNGLEKISPNLFSADDGETRFLITGKIGPNMLKLFEQQRKVKVIEQDAGNGNIVNEGTEGVPVSSDN